MHLSAAPTARESRLLQTQTPVLTILAHVHETPRQPRARAPRPVGAGAFVSLLSASFYHACERACARCQAGRGSLEREKADRIAEQLRYGQATGHWVESDVGAALKPERGIVDVELCLTVRVEVIDAGERIGR